MEGTPPPQPDPDNLRDIIDPLGGMDRHPSATEPAVVGAGWRRIVESLAGSVAKQRGVRSAAPKMIALRLCTIVAGFAASVLIARILGPTEKGIYNFVVLLPVLFISIVDFGANAGTFVTLAKGRATLRECLGNVVIQCLITFGLALVLVTVGHTLLASIFADIPRLWLFVGLVILAPLAAWGAMHGILLLGSDRALAGSMVSLLQQVLIVVGAVVVLSFALGLAGMIWMMVATTVLVQIAITVALQARQPASPRPRFKVWLGAIRFGPGLYLASLLAMLHMRVDQVMIAGRFSTADLGQYALAVSIGELLWSIDMPVIAAAQFRVASDGGSQAGEFVDRVTRMLVIVMTAVCIGAALLGPLLIPVVYGDVYRPAVTPFLLYLPGVFFLAIGRSVGQDVGFQRERTDLVLYGNALAFAVNLFMLFVLLPKFGIAGAAAASSVSYLVMFGWSTLTHCRLAGSSITSALRPRSSDVLELAGIARSILGRSGRNAPISGA